MPCVRDTVPDRVRDTAYQILKTPRRNFVVEFKNSRRQPTAQTTSIWGNIDLQGVARQVSDDGFLPAREKTVTEPVVTSEPQTTALPSDAGIPMEDWPYSQRGEQSRRDPSVSQNDPFRSAGSALVIRLTGFASTGRSAILSL